MSQSLTSHAQTHYGSQSPHRQTVTTRTPAHRTREPVVSVVVASSRGGMFVFWSPLHVGRCLSSGSGSSPVLDTSLRWSLAVVGLCSGSSHVLTVTSSPSALT
ncbi:uncharacterized protein DS421_5g144020 [Arachis hypogaea]|nr:uncharacterized protein DS421_5g144020 [Arachis hypogaea]